MICLLAVCFLLQYVENNEESKGNCRNKREGHEAEFVDDFVETVDSA